MTQQQTKDYEYLLMDKHNKNMTMEKKTTYSTTCAGQSEYPPGEKKKIRPLFSNLYIINSKYFKDLTLKHEIAMGKYKE